MFSLITTTGPTLAESAQSANSSAVTLGHAEGYSIFGTFTVSTPTAKVFASSTDIDATANTFTKAAHGVKTGLKGQFSTSSALPTGISGGVDYFAIVVDANTLQFATSLINANAGTAVDISTTGTGNQTFTPTAIAGGAAKLQASNDGVNYVDVVSSSQNITVTTTLEWEKDRPFYKYFRVALTLTAGQVTSAFSYLAKG